VKIDKPKTVPSTDTAAAVEATPPPEPPGAEPAVTEPAVTEPAVTEPGLGESAVAEPQADAVAVVDLDGDEPAVVVPVSAEPAPAAEPAAPPAPVIVEAVDSAESPTDDSAAALDDAAPPAEAEPIITSKPADSDSSSSRSCCCSHCRRTASRTDSDGDEPDTVDGALDAPEIDDDSAQIDPAVIDPAVIDHDGLTDLDADDDDDEDEDEDLAAADGVLDGTRDIVYWLLTPLLTILIGPALTASIGFLVVVSDNGEFCQRQPPNQCEEVTAALLTDHARLFVLALALLWAIPWWRGLRTTRLVLAAVTIAILVLAPLRLT
jgi:hypothetical protein